MVMGPTHAMSGAAASLAVISIYTVNVGPVHPTIAILGSVMAAGAALAPDIDSKQSTVVRSFGIFGLAAYHVANSLSVAVHNITRGRRDEMITNGHRTLFHTSVMAILMGVLVAALTTPTEIIKVAGEEYSIGQFNAVILMSIFINLSFSGLLEKRIKKARKQFGPYILMAVSLGLAALLSRFMPTPDGTYAYLGLAVGFGWYMHLLGDAITKMGVPLAWPIKVRGKRWYDVSLPSFMRISAGGKFEYVFLLPALTLITIGLFIYNIVLYSGVA
jgi:membrane-bound metal-dependent hydrolase YbcI (DUF457 family)